MKTSNLLWTIFGIFVLLILVLITYAAIDKGSTIPLAQISGAQLAGKTITSQNVLVLANAQRSNAGLVPLAENDKLDGVAHDVLIFLESYNQNGDPTSALQQSESGLLLSHAYSAAQFSENYAHASARNSVQDVITGWMSWGPDKAAMLTPAATQTGIAVDGLWVVQVYAEPAQ